LLFIYLPSQIAVGLKANREKPLTLKSLQNSQTKIAWEDFFQLALGITLKKANQEDKKKD